jgi:hypothetical protein
VSFALSINEYMVSGRCRIEDNNIFWDYITWQPWDHMW